jgi:hypothetical protein
MPIFEVWYRTYGSARGTVEASCLDEAIRMARDMDIDVNRQEDTDWEVDTDYMSDLAHEQNLPISLSDVPVEEEDVDIADDDDIWDTIPTYMPDVPRKGTKDANTHPENFFT